MRRIVGLTDERKVRPGLRGESEKERRKEKKEEKRGRRKIEKKSERGGLSQY